MNGLCLQRGGRWLFSGISFHLKPGEFVAVTGASGSGKSSLLEVLVGVSASSKGSVLITSKSLTMGWMDQEVSLIRELSARTNIQLGRLKKMGVQGLLGCRSRDQTKEIVDLLRRLDCDFDPDTPVSLLSGGERQRVMIARLLYQKPSVLVLDEPFSMLQENLIPKISELLLEFVQAGGAVVCALHEISRLKFTPHQVIRLEPPIAGECS